MLWSGSRITLGGVWLLISEYGQAAGFQLRALALYEDVGDRLGQAEVLNSMGAGLAASAGPQVALASCRRALELARRVQSPLEEARALDGAARCLVRVGESQPAQPMD